MAIFYDCNEVVLIWLCMSLRKEVILSSCEFQLHISFSALFQGHLEKRWCTLY